MKKARKAHADDHTKLMTDVPGPELAAFAEEKQRRKTTAVGEEEKTRRWVVEKLQNNFRGLDKADRDAMGEVMLSDVGAARDKGEELSTGRGYFQTLHQRHLQKKFALKGRRLFCSFFGGMVVVNYRHLQVG